jgi:hypothetical protein
MSGERAAFKFSPHARFLKRQLSFPVSIMSQWCVKRSNSALVILADMKTFGENFDHLPFTVAAASMLAPYPLDFGRRHPILEWSPVPQCPWLAGEDWHICQGS